MASQAAAATACAFRSTSIRMPATPHLPHVPQSEATGAEVAQHIVHKHEVKDAPVRLNNGTIRPLVALEGDVASVVGDSHTALVHPVVG